MTKIISFFLSLITLFGFIGEGIPYCFEPTLEVNAAVSAGEISSRAMGCLYGLAQEGVPDSAMVESLDVSSVSQKVIGGLQHPIGDVDNVAANLDSCDYITVYLQDCFDTWYYCSDEIWSLRKSGEYDYMAFVRERFLPQVEEKVTELSKKDYADRLVYCLYNEADNGVWFGTMSEDGTWLMFDDAAKQRFYQAWKETYDLVKSIDPSAKIGGPGNCDYDAYEITDFLSYCKANACLPDVMIYHELSDRSSLYWNDHVDEYREIEKSLGLGALPVIVTEYGTMQECGAPADMLSYIVEIEKSGVWANMAYWRLASNLNDTAADANSPNSNWWLFRWYADMSGSLLESKIIDILHADFANVIKYNYDRFHYSGFTGLASLNEAEDELTVLCGGGDYTGYVRINNLDETNIGNNVNVKIEAVYYEGLSGVVNEPYTVCEYTAKAACGKLKIALENPDPTAVYRISVTAAQEEKSYFNSELPVRFEFENGVLSGGTYTYDSAYATTGEQSGMVGGFENEGDGVTLSFKVEKAGYYDLSVIFGKGNDGSKPDDRDSALACLALDSSEEEITFPNTIKSEYTNKLTLVRYLEAGEHTLYLAHKQGTFVLDSLLVVPHSSKESVYVFADEDRTDKNNKSFLVIAPQDGFYEMNIGCAAEFEIDGAKGSTESGSETVYLRRGLNYIDVKTGENITCSVKTTDKENFSAKINADEMTLRGSAEINGEYISKISCASGSAEFTVNAPRAGSYRLTLAYSNNAEGGVHSYNVDLIERFVTVTVGEAEQNLWCANTYSWSNVKTATLNIELEEGENIITLSNNGAVKFNGQDSVAPRIFSASVNLLCD